MSTSPLFDDAPEPLRTAKPRYAEASDLVPVGLDFHGREARLAPLAAEAWLNMVEAARGEGVSLLLISAFRSIEYQRGIIERKRARGLGWEEILRVSAYPGFSEHHTGCAVDIASPECTRLEEFFERTPEFAWLSANAGRFGFRLSFPRENTEGLAYEPWHWCWKA
jgi:D-alanyl-D-alanine carboxypeptidase